MMAGSKKQRLPQQSNFSRPDNELSEILARDLSKPSAESKDTTEMGVYGHQPVAKVNSLKAKHENIRKLVPGEGGKRKRTNDQSKPPEITVRLGRNGKTPHSQVAATPRDSEEGFGICHHVNSDQWEANVRVPGVQIPGYEKSGIQIFLGNYKTPDEAKDVHDWAALKLLETKGVNAELNFPVARHASYMEEHKGWSFRDFVWKFRRYADKFTKGLSSMKGVTVRRRGTQLVYEAKIAHTYSNQKIVYELGKFESEEEAGRAYDRALLFIHQDREDEQKLHVITNFRPSRYSEPEIQMAKRACKGRREIRVA